MLKSGYSTNRGRWPQGAQLTWTPSDSTPTTWAHRPSLGVKPSLLKCTDQEIET